MEKTGTVAVISGPSGVGKDTVINEIESLSGFKKLAAYTTRPIRTGEVNGKDYHFVSHQEFTTLRNKHEFLDCTELKGHLYGTPLYEFEVAIREGKRVIVHLRASSALLLQRRVSNVKTVFMLPPSAKELEKRLRHRGASEEDIAVRMNNVKEECQQAISFDLIVINYTDEVQNVSKRIVDFLE